jgi:hypothetical protein
MEFWYKPFSGMEGEKKIQKKLSKEEAKTKEQFKDVEVEYAITTYEGSISKPFTHGDYFGCWQVVNWKKVNVENNRVIEVTPYNRVLFNDETFNNVWHKAVLASKEDKVEELTSLY